MLRLLLGAVICGTVLFLPLAGLTAGGTGASPSPACPHCSSFGPGACQCCQPDQPGHCGDGNQGDTFSCFCSVGSPAFISPPVSWAPTWQSSPYFFALTTVSSKTFPLNIFHPPEHHPLLC